MSNLNAARRTGDTADKAVAVEQRLNNLVNQVNGGTGVIGAYNTSTQTVTAGVGSPVPIAGLTITLPTAGVYAYYSCLQVASDNGTGVLGFLYMSGTATVTTFREFLTVLANGGAVTFKVQTTFGNGASASWQLNNSGSTQYLCTLQGVAVVTAPGTFGMFGYTQTGDGFTTGSGAFLTAWLIG